MRSFPRFAKNATGPPAAQRRSQLSSVELQSAWTVRVLTGTLGQGAQRTRVGAARLASLKRHVRGRFIGITGDGGFDQRSNLLHSSRNPNLGPSVVSLALDIEFQSQIGGFTVGPRPSKAGVRAVILFPVGLGHDFFVAIKVVKYAA